MGFLGGMLVCPVRAAKMGRSEDVDRLEQH